jgi:hypothetical protein
MPEWIVEVAKVVLPGLIVAIITSVVTVRLSLTRFYAEKWWEKKHQVYADILEALHHLKKYSLEHLDAEQQRKEIPPEKIKELDSDRKAFAREFDRLYDLASFQLSHKAVRILQEYRNNRIRVDEPVSVYELIENDADAAIDCLTKLTTEAKKDLRIR